MPARYAPTTATGTSTSAVPRSGCSRIRPSGHRRQGAGLAQIRRARAGLCAPPCKKRASTIIIINLASSDTWKNCPSTGSQRLAPKRVWPTAKTATSASKSDEIKNRRFIEHGMVIEPREQQHAHEAHADPPDLLPLHAGETAGVRGRPDFEHADAADRERRWPEATSRNRETWPSLCFIRCLREVSRIRPRRARLNARFRAARLVNACRPSARAGTATERRGGDACVTSCAGALTLLLVVVRLDDVARDGRGGFCAKTTGLHQHGDDDLGIAARRKTHKPGVVLQVCALCRRAALPFRLITCAVPVLPQNSMPGSLDAAAVPPSLTTPYIACVTKSTVVIRRWGNRFRATA